jgi:hypothetical protein
MKATRQVRGAQQLVGEKTSGSVGAAEAGESAASPPVPADDNVQEYCASALAPAQVFWLRPNRDTVLVGQQGTVVAVPAGAWDLPAGSDGAVRLAMQEFYTTPDIVLAGLSTASGANLLETGGMINLTATVGEEPVALRPGQRLLLRMPTSRKLENMQLFRGVGSQSSHGLDWQLPPATVASNVVQIDLESRQVDGFDLEKGGRWPKMPGSEKALLKFFDRRVPHSTATLARLRRSRFINSEEKAMLRAYSKANHKRVLRAVRVQFRVDSTGTVLPAALLPNGDDEIGAGLLAAVGQLPKWRPAQFRRLLTPHRSEKINAEGVLSLLYTAAGKRLIGVQWDHEATHMPRIERYVSALAAKERREGQQKFAAQFASAGPLTLNDNLHYELEAGGLGWINCDRFLEPGPRIEFAVQTAQPNTVVTLVFQNQRSILASTRTEAAAAIFAQVPVGAPATVVAIRREKGITFLATAAATLGPESRPNLDFKPVSLEELRTALAKL